MKKHKRKTKIIILGCAVVILIVAAAIYVENHHPAKSAQTKAATPADNQSGKAASGSSKATAGASAQPGASAQSSAPATVSTPGHPISSSLAKPTGEVLSNSPISLANDPGMDSSCNTVIGADCGLQLTGPGGVVKTINPTATDAGGGNDFTWNAKTIGLTPGSWSVQLLATYKGQSSLSDAYTLTVNP